VLNDPDLHGQKWRTQVSAKQETPFNAGSHADLSESALPYTTKEIEVEEGDFGVEINGLVNGGRWISERGTRVAMFGD